MKQYFKISMLFAVMLVIMMSCKKDSETTCNLSATVNQAPVGMSIVYAASQTGDGVISSLTYVSGTGNVTVTNPSLPWSVTVYVPAGTGVTLSASGSVKNGSLNVSYEGSAEGYHILGSDACSKQTQ